MDPSSPYDSGPNTTLIVIGILVTMGILRRIAPVVHRTDTPPRPLFVLHREYGKYGHVETLLGLTSVCAGSYLVYMLLTTVADILHAGLPLSDIVIRAGRGYWIVVGLVGGFVFAISATASLMQLLLRERYAEYIEYRNLANRFNVVTVFRWMFIGASIVFLVSVAAGLNYIVRLTPSALHVRSPHSLRTATFDLSGVAEISFSEWKRVPNGNVVARPHYVFRLGDGTDWSTEDGLGDRDLRRDKEIADRVVQVSGRKVRRVEVLDR